MGNIETGRGGKASLILTPVADPCTHMLSFPVIVCTGHAHRNPPFKPPFICKMALMFSIIAPRWLLTTDIADSWQLDTSYSCLHPENAISAHKFRRKCPFIAHGQHKDVSMQLRDEIIEPCGCGRMESTVRRVAVREGPARMSRKGPRGKRWRDEVRGSLIVCACAHNPGGRLQRPGRRTLLRFYDPE